jgi:hypothetical protein
MRFAHLARSRAARWAKRMTYVRNSHDARQDSTTWPNRTLAGPV